MKYNLNKTPIRTNKGYNINDFKLDINIPEIKEFSKFKTNIDNIKSSITTSFESKIGINFNKCYKLDIDIENKDNYFEYIFNEDILVNEINFNIKNDSNIFIKYISDKEVYNNVKININTSKNINTNVTILNNLNNESSNFMNINSLLNENSSVILNFIDIGSKNKISNITSTLHKNSKYELNNIYVGKKDNKIDMNFYAENKEENTVSKIVSEGALTSNAIKHFKGTIDFIKGCKNSIGEENENCVLLSENAKSISLPMLLCHEDDVKGSHGVSTGKIDLEKLFYIKSRGISEKDAKKLIIFSNFNKVINKVPNEIKEEIIKVLNDIF